MMLRLHFLQRTQKVNYTYATDHSEDEQLQPNYNSFTKMSVLDLLSVTYGKFQAGKAQKTINVEPI